MSSGNKRKNKIERKENRNIPNGVKGTDFEKYYVGEWIPSKPTTKCNYGYHWVNGYNRKDGTHVKGHCVKDFFTNEMKLRALIKGLR